MAVAVPLLTASDGGLWINGVEASGTVRATCCFPPWANNSDWRYWIANNVKGMPFTMYDISV